MTSQHSLPLSPSLLLTLSLTFWTVKIPPTHKRSECYLWAINFCNSLTFLFLFFLLQHSYTIIRVVRLLLFLCDHMYYVSKKRHCDYVLSLWWLVTIITMTLYSWELKDCAWWLWGQKKRERGEREGEGGRRTAKKEREGKGRNTYTVEQGHYGAKDFVLCREVVPMPEVK